MITIGIDPTRARLPRSPCNPAAVSMPRFGSRSTATPSPGCRPGPSSGRSASGRSRAPPGSAEASRRAWPTPTNPSWTCPPSWPRGPAAEHRAYGADRPHRRCCCRDGRPAPPAAAPGARRGRQPRAAAALRAPRRPGRGTHPTANWLHALLRDLIPGAPSATFPPTRRRRCCAECIRSPPPTPSAHSYVGSWWPICGAWTPRWGESEDIAAAVTVSGTSVTHIHGVGLCWPRRSSDTAARSGVPNPAPLRQLLGHRADRGLQRGAAPSPALPGRQPPAQPRRSSHRGLPDPHPRAGTGVLPAQTRRRRPRRRPGGHSTAGSATRSTAPRPRSTSSYLTYRGAFEFSGLRGHIGDECLMRTQHLEPDLADQLKC